MKFRNNALIIYTLFSLLTSAQSKAQLVGSEVDISSALERSDAVFIGRFANITKPTFQLSGIFILSSYPNQVVVGKNVIGKSRSNIVLGFRLNSGYEMTPTLNSNYIFFTSTVDSPEHNQARIVKLLPVDNSTIAQVMALISQSVNDSITPAPSAQPSH